MPSRKKPAKPELTGDFESLVAMIVQIHNQAQNFATKAVNIGLTLRNWLIGHRIVEFEQKGNDRAAYGERLLPTLAKRLAAAGLTRVDARELRRFRLLYTVYPQIRETVSPESLAHASVPALQPFLQLAALAKRESVSPKSSTVESSTPQLGPVHPDLLHRLSFSHLAELLELPDETQAFSHEDLGQLNTYVAYYKKHEMTAGDQPPIGILLCTRKNEALVEFALGDISNQLFVSRYAVEMPKKEEMEQFLQQLGKEVGDAR